MNSEDAIKAIVRRVGVISLFAPSPSTGYLLADRVRVLSLELAQELTQLSQGAQQQPNLEVEAIKRF